MCCLTSEAEHSRRSDDANQGWYPNIAEGQSLQLLWPVAEHRRAPDLERKSIGKVALVDRKLKSSQIRHSCNIEGILGGIIHKSYIVATGTGRWSAE